MNSKELNLDSDKLKEIKSNSKAGMYLRPEYALSMCDALKAKDKEIERLEKSKKELDFTKGTLVQYFGANKWNWNANDVMRIISHTHFDEIELKEAIVTALNKKGTD